MSACCDHFTYLFFDFCYLFSNRKYENIWIKYEIWNMRAKSKKINKIYFIKTIFFCFPSLLISQPSDLSCNFLWGSPCWLYCNPWNEFLVIYQVNWTLLRLVLHVGYISLISYWVLLLPSVSPLFVQFIFIWSLVYSTGVKQLSMMICTNSPSKGQLHAGWFVSLLGWHDRARYEKREGAGAFG